MAADQQIVVPQDDEELRKSMLQQMAIEELKPQRTNHKSMKIPTSQSTKDSDMSSQDNQAQVFNEFDDDERRSSLDSSQKDDEDDYENMLGNSARSSKTLEKGKNGSKSKRARPAKDPKAIVTQDQQSSVNEKNCGACLLF